MTKRTKRVEELLRAALAAQHSGHKEPSPAVGEKDGIPMEERKTETIAEEPEKEREEDAVPELEPIVEEESREESLNRFMSYIGVGLCARVLLLRCSHATLRTGWLPGRTSVSHSRKARCRRTGEPD